jgi:AcrR family transcriptional regulator
MGVQKGSLYAHISSKQDLLYETMREGADAFHAALDAIPDELPATEKIWLARAATCASSLSSSTLRPSVARVKVSAATRSWPSAGATMTRRALFREVAFWELRTDLDD